MPRPLMVFVRVVDVFNRIVGRATMYLIFVIMGVLLWSSISKTFILPSLWTLEMAQFLMVGYFMLGGPYSLQLGSNVRMDLFYSMWSDRTRAWVDAFTVIFLLIFLGVLLYGGWQSTAYALEYGERSRTAWRPYMAPIKIIMCIAIVMMILQAIAHFLRDVARIRGEDLP
ncbi:MAG TPA: TRAP transporter small permease subunit [Paracoccaceae bacterium]|nr:TRAP transporter small permease subunit [Paracoccaceae bacterium]